MTQTHLEDVQRYYQQTSTDYRLLWRGKAQAMHFGYWTKDTRTHNDSLLEMNRQIAQAAGISAADHVLDAGCGVGGTSRWLAQTYGCRVTGINITRFQVEQARATTQRQELDALVTFEQQDYGHTQFADAAFTVVWFQESLVHAPRKDRVIAEASRVLKPGGRLVIADYALNENLTAEQMRSMQNWWEGWAMPPLNPLSAYRKFLEDAGFGDVKLVNFGAGVEQSLRRLWWMSAAVRPAARLLYHLRIFPPYRYRNIHASVLQYETFKQGLWQHTLIGATKNA